MPNPPDFSALPVGGWRWLRTTASTNTDALVWAEQGAPDLAMVAADEQTAGRGRMGRPWFTSPGSALAFSLVHRPSASFDLQGSAFSRLTGLGALAVCQALQELCGLPAEIKWPNDILLHGQKTAGVLVEAAWQGEALLAAVTGIGVNITPASIPPEDQVIFPATCVECALGRPQDRWELLRAIIEKIVAWRSHLSTPAFLHAWEDNLAYKGLWVPVVPGLADGPDAGLPARRLLVLGLEQDGALLVQTEEGEQQVLHSGEVRFAAG